MPAVMKSKNEPPSAAPPAVHARSRTAIWMVGAAEREIWGGGGAARAGGSGGGGGRRAAPHGFDEQPQLLPDRILDLDPRDRDHLRFLTAPRVPDLALSEAAHVDQRPFRPLHLAGEIADRGHRARVEHADGAAGETQREEV